MKIHLIGICGAGMGSLAMLFREAGHDVSGSDVAFDPPTGPALRAAGIPLVQGYAAKNLEPAPDLVVVGNAIRKDNPEAAAARELSVPALSMSGALRRYFLEGRRPLVVAGTHGKTTTSTMCAWILARAGFEPGWFIGGVPKDLPAGAAVGRAAVSLTKGKTPFVVEGDEYDDVYWSKRAKFFDYVGVAQDDVVILTSVEHDHVDIYPSASAYEAAFEGLARAVPPAGLIVCDAHDLCARAIASKHARARVSFYALEADDTGDVTPTWLAAPATQDASGTSFDVYGSGSYFGRFSLGVPGRHNVRNALASLAACAEGFHVPPDEVRVALASFRGVRRRQDLLGEPRGVRVYDDFAHHPTAVDETLRALRAKHREGTLWAVFEPRSATACRSLHQVDYERAFDAADRVILAPLGRTTIPEPERLDLTRLARALGDKAEAAPSIEAILDRLTREAKAGDTIALLSNGAFGGIHERLLAALADGPGSS
jgi:UDP-N-acetylmuramate: L-alanyl-gamma-D-glutamyl-meso-diaminopimelate ligase